MARHIFALLGLSDVTHPCKRPFSIFSSGRSKLSASNITGFGTQGSQVRILPLRPEIVGLFPLIRRSVKPAAASATEPGPAFWSDCSWRPVPVIRGLLQDPRKHFLEPSSAFAESGAGLHRTDRVPRCSTSCAPRFFPLKTLGRFDVLLRGRDPLPVEGNKDWLAVSSAPRMNKPSRRCRPRLCAKHECMRH